MLTTKVQTYFCKKKNYLTVIQTASNSSRKFDIKSDVLKKIHKLLIINQQQDDDKKLCLPANGKPAVIFSKLFLYNL